MLLRELVDECFGADIRDRGEGEVNVCCPFCSDSGLSEDRAFRLGINTETAKAHCFHCDWSATGAYLFSALADQFGIEYKRTRGEQTELPVTENKKKSLGGPIWLPEEFEPLYYEPDDDVDFLEHKARKYLAKRGVTSSQIKEHRLGFCAIGKYAKRIIFPVFKETAIVGYVGRTFGASDVKYLNNEGEKYLYNVPIAENKKKKAILVEGVFDALAVERATLKYYDAIARFGSTLTDIQLEALQSYRELVVWPDPDKPGIQGAIKVLDELKVGNNLESIKVIVPQENDTDPGSMLSATIRKRIQSAIPWSRAAHLRLKVRASR